MTTDQTGARPMVDFDHWSHEYAKAPDDYNLRYSAKCPVAYSEHHGGYWFVTGYDELSTVVHDDARFSSRHDLPNGSTPYQGTQHPPTPFRVAPLETDPPEHSLWRQGLSPYFSPKAVKRYVPWIQDVATALIDEHIESGSIDLLDDLTSPLASIVNMKVLGIPAERGKEFAHLSHAIAFTSPATPEFAQIYADYQGAVASLIDVIHARRAEPRDDVISLLAHMHLGDRRMTDDEAMEALDLIVSAGIDTTASGMASALKYLNDHPEDRQRLIDEPVLIPKATEEFLRYYSPVQVLARTATCDTELGGQQIREGERVLVSWAAANVDDRVFPDPTRVSFDRFPNRHAAFGLGVHRCLGAHIARADFNVVLKEVLTRMPDYRLGAGVEAYGCIGVVRGFVNLPATFTPGPRIGTKV
jgi:cytochrome P450